MLSINHDEFFSSIKKILSDIQTKVDTLLKANSENKNRIAQASEEPMPATILMSVTKGKLPAILEDDSHVKHQCTFRPFPLKIQNHLK